MAKIVLNLPDLRNLGTDELKEKLEHLKKEVMQFRFQAQTGKLERQHLLTAARKNAARILTIIREKELEQKAQGQS